MKARPSYGKPIENGLLRYMSPSSHAKADFRTREGCLRRYAYKYVFGAKEPQGKGAALGEKLHGECEHTILTGDDILSTIPSAGRPWVLHGRVRSHVELAIAGGAPGETIDPSTSLLKLDGVPYIGFIDELNLSGEWVDKAGAIVVEPYPEVNDWKFLGSLDYAASDASIGDLFPMIAYGHWTALKTGADHVRLSHTMFLTKGAAKVHKATALIPAADLLKKWESNAIIVRSVRDVAKSTNVDQVDANVRACGAYGGCPHKVYCRAANQVSLASVIGDPTMSVIDSAAPNFSNMFKAPAPAGPTDAEIGAAFQALKASGYGFPALSGNLAVKFAALCGQTVPLGYTTEGEGDMASANLSEVDQLLTLAGEVAKAPPKVAPVVTVASTPAPLAPLAPLPKLGALPADAPKSNPALAADPVAGFAMPGTTPAAVDTLAGFATAKADASNVEPAPKKKGGRPRKNPEGTAPVATTTIENDSTDDGFVFYVDAIPNVAAESLTGYIAAVCAALAKQYQAADIRCAPADGPLGYGKWKGALAAYVRECPPAIGTYFLDARGSEINECVAEGLRDLADATGGTFVRGIR